jgi:CotH kinase protein
MKFFRLLCFLLPLYCSAQVNFTSSNLPIVLINTNGQAIPQEPKITAQMQVLYNGPGLRNYMTDTPKDYNGLIGIERRGSTSDFFSEKKPYSVEIRDLQGEDLDFPLLGMPTEADWAFLAPYNDKSLVRDAFMFELARRIMPWAPRTRFVELVLNGEYQGVYLVTEKIKRGNNRVDISKLKETDLAGDSLTGGYILKIDKTTGEVGANWVSPYPPFPGAWQSTLWQVHYPKVGDIQPQQRQYINNWVNNFEAVMASTAYADTATGYPKLLDAPSFIDFILLNEIAKNVDGYRLSTYFYKDRNDNDARLHAGPIWDFNIGLGNADYCGGESTANWAIDFNNICSGDSWVIQFWWQKLWRDQEFRRQVKERWIELRQGTFSNAAILQVMDSLTNVLNESQSRNFQRWPVLNQYLWPNPYCCGTYFNHTNYLRNWLQGRLAWMDNTAKTLYVGEYAAEKRFSTVVSPNPSSGELQFKMYLRYNDAVRIRIHNAMGQYMNYLDYDPELNGENALNWTHSLRSGVYFYEVLINGKRESSGKFMVR